MLDPFFFFFKKRIHIQHHHVKFRLAKELPFIVCLNLCFFFFFLANVLNSTTFSSVEHITKIILQPQ